MANVRGKNQKLVAFPLDEDLLRSVDTNRGRDSRSQFIRDALASYLRNMGISIADGIASAPDRAGMRLAEESASGPLPPQKPVTYNTCKGAKSKNN